MISVGNSGLLKEGAAEGVLSVVDDKNKTVVSITYFPGEDHSVIYFKKEGLIKIDGKFGFSDETVKKTLSDIFLDPNLQEFKEYKSICDYFKFLDNKRNDVYRFFENVAIKNGSVESFAKYVLLGPEHSIFQDGQEKYYYTGLRGYSNLGSILLKIDNVLLKSNQNFDDICSKNYSINGPNVCLELQSSRSARICDIKNPDKFALKVSHTRIINQDIYKN